MRCTSDLSLLVDSKRCTELTHAHAISCNPEYTGDEVETKIQADASKGGLGGVLLQKTYLGDWGIVAYASRARKGDILK